VDVDNDSFCYAIRGYYILTNECFDKYLVLPLSFS